MHQLLSQATQILCLTVTPADTYQTMSHDTTSTFPIPIRSLV